MDYSFMLPFAQDPRLFHVDAIAAECAGTAEVRVHALQYDM